MPLLWFGCSYDRQEPRISRMDSAAIQTFRQARPTDSVSAGHGHPRVLSSGQDLPANAAYLGYAYPPKITRGGTSIFYAYVSIVDSNLLIRQSLNEDITTTEGAQGAADTIVIYPRDISFYHSIHLSLTSPAGDFQITPNQTSDTQVINLHFGAHWQWTLTTETDKPTAQLLLKAEGLQAEGAPEQLDTRIIPIRILIQPNIFRTIFLYLADHPAVSVPALIALLGFIGWLIKHFLSKAKSDGK